jgi:hypothetical protein
MSHFAFKRGNLSSFIDNPNAPTGSPIGIK